MCDYRQLNANTVPDNFALPRVDDILADCAKGKIWATIDMTDSFFQTRLHPDDIHKTAVTTPFGNYEWCVMPMGFRNSPAIQQRRVTNALRAYIGKICHIYLDDIVVWSNNIEEYIINVRKIMEALREAKLYVNEKKTHLFCYEIKFLGHKISQRGIEADESKVSKILDWPVPKNAGDVRAFLGLVRYLNAFLPCLAIQSNILSRLTTKECDKNFPKWTAAHQDAFLKIKDIVVSRECLTVIDHKKLDSNKIFLTAHASDCKGSDNTVADALSHYPSTLPVSSPTSIEAESTATHPYNHPTDIQTNPKVLEHKNPQNSPLAMIASLVDSNIPKSIRSTLTIDVELVKKIQEGYVKDPWCQKLLSASKGMPELKIKDGLWFLGNRLIIPSGCGAREHIFQLTHDSLGHFGFFKCYENIRQSYFWPGMRKDLEEGYIPSCAECLRNKSSTSKPSGPLHPLPIPDEHCDSVSMDFIGPLPLDNDFDCILTITDRLNSDVRIIPTKTSLTAEELATLFFESWYCENGLPIDNIRYNIRPRQIIYFQILETSNDSYWN